MPHIRDVASDLVEINEEVCRRVWRMVAVGDVPSALAPRLIYPKYNRTSSIVKQLPGDATIKLRRSEQEARFAYAEVLAGGGVYYYSVESPTEED